MLSFFRDETATWLVKGLDAAALRQQVTAHNLANLNTPNFKRSDVSFEEQLTGARNKLGTPLSRTHEKHFPVPPHPDISPQVLTDTTTTRRIDGNNVDIEREMLNLVSNQLRYNAYVQRLNGRYNNWRFVINEGRR